MEVQQTKSEEIKTTVESLVTHLAEHVETYLKLGAITAMQKGTDVAAATLATLLLATLCLFVLFFASLGVSIWLGEIWGNPKAGYFAVGGFYLLCTLILLAFRKRLISPFLKDYIIKQDRE